MSTISMKQRVSWKQDEAMHSPGLPQVTHFLQKAAQLKPPQTEDQANTPAWRNVSFKPAQAPTAASVALDVKIIQPYFISQLK